MAATSTLVRYEDPLEARERGAIAGFLAGYSGNTRVSYTTDLRLFAAWCADHRVRLLEVHRAQLEMFARTMEQEGRMRSTVPAACRPCAASTATATSKGCWPATRRPT